MPDDPYIEHFRRKVLRSEIDPDIAEAQIAAYLERGSAIREPRRHTLEDVPRPKPAKHSGETVRRIGAKVS